MASDIFAVKPSYLACMSESSSSILVASLGLSMAPDNPSQSRTRSGWARVGFSKPILQQRSAEAMSPRMHACT